MTVDYSRALVAEEELETETLVTAEGEPQVDALETPATAQTDVDETQRLAEEAAKAAAQLRVNQVKIALPDATTEQIPEWVQLPPGMRFPKGKQIIFLRFRASMTDTPYKGERQAIVWSCNLGDQKLAINRANKDPNKLGDELTKQMVRGIDGQRADWSGVPGVANIDQWWDEIGPKCRNVLDKIFAQLHIASREEAVDFFENCVAVRAVTG